MLWSEIDDGSRNASSSSSPIMDSSSSNNPLSSSSKGGGVSLPRGIFSKEVPSCGACRRPLSRPCILVCFHVVCAECLSSIEGKPGSGGKALNCPICGTQTNLHEGDDCPPVDLLLKILIESAQKELSLCANCDATEKASMFFCNTCSQTLCPPCRTATHAAKMFSQHEIIPLSQRHKTPPKKCGTHGEPVSMFCSPRNELFCGKCYAEADLELKMGCLDIESAYKEGIYEVEKSLIRTWDLNASLSQLLSSYRSAESELSSSLESQRSELKSKYSSILSLISGAYEGILRGLESSFGSRRHELRSAASSVANILPTLKMHLLLLSGFAFSAPQTEFLGLVYQAINRLNLLSQFSIPERQPPLSTNLGSPDASTKFLCRLESLQLHLGPHKKSSSNPHSVSTSSKKEHKGPKANKSSHHLLLAPGKTLPPGRKLGKKKVPKDVGGLDTEHLMKDLKRSFGDIKDQMGSLHLMLTSGRPGGCLRTLNGILQEASVLKKEINSLEGNLSQRQRVLSDTWEEEQKRFLREQSSLNDQLNDLNHLRHNLTHIINLTSQIQPYLKSPYNTPIEEEMDSHEEEESGRDEDPSGHSPAEQAGGPHDEEDEESQEIRCSISQLKGSQLGELLRVLLNSQNSGSNASPSTQQQQQLSSEKKSSSGLLCSLFERVRAGSSEDLKGESSGGGGGMSVQQTQQSHHHLCKPYEPPGLGKPSRVTPLVCEMSSSKSPPCVEGSPPPPSSAVESSSLLESDSVEVLSVIRFNKMKFGGGGSSSEKQSSSSSGGESLFNGSSCYSCEAAAAAKKAAAYDASEAGSEEDDEFSEIPPPGTYAEEEEEIKALVHERGLKRADSFEGHEEAVRTLVEAVQESRKQHEVGPKRSNDKLSAGSSNWTE